MMTINDVFEQAIADHESTNLDFGGYEARLLCGCKIKRDKSTGEIVILNTAIGGDWYTPINESDMNNFIRGGWKFGAYVLSLSNYRVKLDLIERMIHKEVNGRNNPKQIIKLKLSRERVMNYYTTVSHKLNQINNGKTISIQDIERNQC